MTLRPFAKSLILSGLSSSIRSISGVLIAAAAMVFVSIFTFRLADGMLFAVSAFFACGIVYSLGFLNKKWT